MRGFLGPGGPGSVGFQTCVAELVVYWRKTRAGVVMESCEGFSRLRVRYPRDVRNPDPVGTGG